METSTGYDILIDNIYENCPRFSAPSIAFMFTDLVRDYGAELFPDHSRFLRSDDPMRVTIIKENLPGAEIDIENAGDGYAAVILKKIADGYRQVIARLRDEGEVMYPYLPLEYVIEGGDAKRILVGIRYSIEPLKKRPWS